MSSGKSLDLITTAYNYSTQNKKTMIYTSSVDTRSGYRKIESRIGHSCEARYVPENGDDLYEEVKRSHKESKVFCILVDESQFLKKEHILIFSKIVDDFKIPVICWGLKNDFQNNLFEGSSALLAYADKILSLKTICYLCNNKATMNLRTNNGKAVYHGEQIMVGDDEYLPVCRNCFYNYDELVMKKSKI